MERKMKLLAMFLMLYLMMSAMGTTGRIQSIESPANETELAFSVDVIEPFSDPEIDSEHTTTVNGSSGEFSAMHHPAAGDESSHMALNWTHTPNTTLSWREESSYDYVDCNDFIFFTESFEWEYERMPADVGMNLRFAIDATGDFNSSEGHLMFRIYVWLIDSSGNWKRIYRSYPPYYDIYYDRRIDLTYLDIVEGFRGMIEDSDGIQQDPSDTLTVAVGLAPSRPFEEYSGQEPWRFYDGSVIARIDSWSMQIYMSDGRQPEMTPIFNHSYSTPAREVMLDPDYQDDYAGAMYKDMAIASDNSIVTVGHTSYHWRPYYFSYGIVAKWDANTNLQWVRRLDNLTNLNGVAIFNDQIYAVGLNWTTYDLIIVKLDMIGNILWQTTWDSGYEDRRAKIAVDEIGQLYVAVANTNYTVEPSYMMGNIVCFTDTGEYLWNRTYLGGDPMRIDVASDGRIFNLDFGQLNVWDSSEVHELSVFVRAFALDENDILYTSQSKYLSSMPSVLLTKWTDSLEEEWNLTIGFSIAETEYIQTNCFGLDIDAEGSVLAVLGVSHIVNDWLLAKISPNGILEWNRTIADDHWIHGGGGGIIDIRVGTNGLAYLGMQKIFATTGYSMSVDAFIVGDYIPPILSLDLLLPIIGIAGVGVLVVAVILRRRRQI